MKLLTVLLVIAIAAGCQARSWQENQSSNESNSPENNNWQTDQQVEEQVESILASSQQDVASIIASQKWNNFGATNPEAAPYQQKIVQRLQTSLNFAGKQNIQQNILNLALEKLNVCKNQSTQLVAIDRNCMGRSTGQMMQLIAAIENVGRNHPRGGYSAEQY